MLKKITIAILILLLIPIAFYLYLYATHLLDDRFTLAEMDLNKDGFVSPGEADYVSESGKKERWIDGKLCTEYYAYKTGMPVKIECNVQDKL